MSFVKRRWCHYHYKLSHEHEQLFHLCDSDPMKIGLDLWRGSSRQREGGAHDFDTLLPSNCSSKCWVGSGGEMKSG